MNYSQLVNSENGLMIVNHVEHANTWFMRLVGLLNKSNIDQEKALLLKPCKSIHTIGMRFSIDVIFLDKYNRVIKLKRNMKPNRICFSNIKTHSVLELSVGSIDCCNISIGTELLFK